MSGNFDVDNYCLPYFPCLPRGEAIRVSLETGFSLLVCTTLFTELPAVHSDPRELGQAGNPRKDKGDESGKSRLRAGAQKMRVRSPTGTQWAWAANITRRSAKQELSPP